MIYEVRTYRLKPGTLAECERIFGDALPRREEFSSLGAFWHTEIGPLNEIIHVWPYESLQQRTEARARAMQSGAWPPPNRYLHRTHGIRNLYPGAFYGTARQAAAWPDI